MIFLDLIGGLGNQMFQYATGIALAQRNNVVLAFDISKFGYYKIHQGFELQQVFNCNNKISTPHEIQKLLGWQSKPVIQRVISKKIFTLLRKREFIVEPHFHYWSGIKNLPQNCYLSGYWQSEKYFLAIESKIRSDFTFRAPMNSKNLEIAKGIGGVNSVSLHVRRGDYITNSKTNTTHGLCSIDYYRSAIQYIGKRIENPHFFVFSDDIEWAKENLQIEQPCHYIDHNKGDESYNDMRLMSFCEHHIIANSSFSWWGAWLNPSKDKIVVTPKKWFSNNNDISDLIPEGWVSL